MIYKGSIDVMLRQAVVAFAAVAFAVSLASHGATAGPDDDALRKAFEESVRAEGRRVGEYTLVDQDSKAFRLGDYFKGNGKPLVVSFIYTSCPDVCPAITADLKRVADSARSKYGDGFNVLNVGFDTKADTSASLREYGNRLTRDFKAFRFATADADTIKRLASDFGFYYSRNRDGSYDHIDMVTIVAADGVIYRQVYGVRNDPARVEDAIAEIVAGRPRTGGQATLLDRIRFFCYRYDPASGRYVIDYPIIAAVLLQTVVIAGIIWFVWGRTRARRRAQ